MMKGTKFYIQYEPYVALTVNGKSITRRLYDDDKADRTGKIRLNGTMVKIKYQY